MLLEIGNIRFTAKLERISAPKNDLGITQDQYNTIKRLIGDNLYIAAIREYRAITSTSLKESKEFVDNIRAREFPNVQ